MQEQVETYLREDETMKAVGPVEYTNAEKIGPLFIPHVAADVNADAIAPGRRYQVIRYDHADVRHKKAVVSLAAVNSFRIGDVYCDVMEPLKLLPKER